MLTAITRKISPAITRCELTHLERQPIDLEKADVQHKEYEQILRSIGVKVISLPVEADLPDSVFVEDAAVVLDEVAVITRPGAESRRPEAASIAAALSPFRKLVYLHSPATLDGGDVLTIGKTIYIGVSSRSNLDAIHQMQNILSPFNYLIEGVDVSGCLHLKSAVTRVSKKTLLINPEWVGKKSFPGMGFIEIDPGEPCAANGLLVGEKVIYPNAFPKTLARLERAGIDVITLDTSELAKAEGAVTCCSLVFKSK
jgi:dimethylargininase